MGNWVFIELSLWTLPFSTENSELRIVNKISNICLSIINIRVPPCVYIAPVS